VSILRQASFLVTVAELHMAPADAVAEVAFVGRSNAGKSSAINTLADHTRLAYVSKTPGRTQHLNYFTVEPGRYLVDLPGYGYAKAPEEVRRAWEKLLGPYLQSRQALSGLVVIMDCRHPLTPLDHQMIEWFLPTGRPVHVLLSKTDKLSRQQAEKVLRGVRATLSSFDGPCTVQLFSSLKKTGVDEARDKICSWLGVEDRAAAKGGMAATKTKSPR
jgi:GTP-binding protein